MAALYLFAEGGRRWGTSREGRNRRSMGSDGGSSGGFGPATRPEAALVGVTRSSSCAGCSSGYWIRRSKLRVLGSPPHIQALADAQLHDLVAPAPRSRSGSTTGSVVLRLARAWLRIGAPAHTASVLWWNRVPIGSP